MTEFLRPTPPAGIAQQVGAVAGQPAVQCERRHLTLLFVAGPAGWACDLPAGAEAALAEVAAALGGRRDPFVQPGALLSFADAAAGVRAALHLQRAVGERLRMGLVTLPCQVASILDGADEVVTVLGPEARLAAQVAATASSGSIVVAPSTYALARHAIQDDCHDCLLAEEFDGADIAGATITPPPARGGPELSTFAGLGLV